MSEIIIKELKVLFDDCDIDLLSNHKWSIRYGWGKTPYVCSTKGILMHRLIMDAPKGLLVDHKNHNTLDNRRENLRLCTRSQNMWNRKKACGQSKYKGVCWHKAAKKWVSFIYLNNKINYLGIFENEKDAAKAYNKRAKELFGEFSCLNKI